MWNFHAIPNKIVLANLLLLPILDYAGDTYYLDIRGKHASSDQKVTIILKFHELRVCMRFFLLCEFVFER